MNFCPDNITKEAVKVITAMVSYKSASNIMFFENLAMKGHIWKRAAYRYINQNQFQLGLLTLKEIHDWITNITMSIGTQTIYVNFLNSLSYVIFVASNPF